MTHLYQDELLEQHLRAFLGEMDPAAMACGPSMVMNSNSSAMVQVQLRKDASTPPRISARFIFTSSLMPAPVR